MPVTDGDPTLRKDMAGIVARLLMDPVRRNFVLEDNGRFKRKLWWLATCAGVGLLASIFLGFVPDDSVIEAGAVWLKAFPGLEGWLKTNSKAIAVMSWVAAPVFFVLIGMLLLSVGKLGFWNRWLGGRPDFMLKNPLVAISETVLIKGYDPTVFVGRQDQLESLRGLLHPQGEAFAWQMVLGRTGIGKTRLCAKMVDELALAARDYNFLFRFRVVRERLLKVPPPHSHAWDAGFVDPIRCGEIADWHPRRPTLLVFDEASRTFGDGLYPLLASLANKGTCRRPVRVLLIDHMSRESAVRQLGMANPVVGRRDPMLLTGLADQEMTELAGRFPGHVLSLPALLATAEGSPRSAIYMLHEGKTWNCRLAMRQWANGMFPGLAPDHDDVLPQPDIEADVAEALVAAALIGPVPIAKTTVADAFNIARKVQRFFPDSDPKIWANTIPGFKPRDLGYEIAFRLFDLMSEKRKEAMISVLLSDLRRLRGSLNEFWLERSSHYSSEQDARLFDSAIAIQDRLDSADLETIERIHTDLASHFEAIAASSNRVEIRGHLDIARTYLQCRPFDPEVLKYCLKCEVNASKSTGKQGAFDRSAVDRLTNPLVVRWLGDPEAARLYLDFLQNLTMVKRSAADVEFLDRAKVFVTPLIQKYHGGEDAIVERAMGVAVNLISRYSEARNDEEVEALVKSMRHALGRAGESACRAIELHFAAGLVGLLYASSAGRSALSATTGARELYELCTADRHAMDLGMRLWLVAGLIKVAKITELSGQEAEARKWRNRLNRATTQVGIDSDTRLIVLTCRALRDLIHANAVRGRFKLAEKQYAQLFGLCHEEPRKLLWELRGALLNAQGCLSNHYDGTVEASRGEELAVLQLECFEATPKLTKEMLERTVLGSFSDFADIISAWASLNHRSAEDGKWDRFDRSMVAWGSFFQSFMEIAKSSTISIQVLGEIRGLMNCVTMHVSQDSQHHENVRRQAGELYLLAPHDPQISALAQKLGVQVNRSPAIRLVAAR